MSFTSKRDFHMSIAPFEKATEEMLSHLDAGMMKQFSIHYKPTGGNSLYLYDENLRLIQDSLSLYNARRVIFTNQVRFPDADLEGEPLVMVTMKLHGRPTVNNWLRLELLDGEYLFRDEYSFLRWERKDGERCMNAYIE